LIGEGDDCCGDRVVQFIHQFDPENPLDTNWSDFKSPVAEHFVPRFRVEHAIAAMFHLDNTLAVKYPVLNGQINAGWQAHSSGNYDNWDKWDKLGWVRISRISRIRLGYPHGTYPEKGVLILNNYPTGISYRIS
jgi:hypothetical protein